MTIKIFEPYNKGRNRVKDRSTSSAFNAYTHIFARHFNVGKVYQVRNPFSLTTQLGLYSLAGVTSLWLLDMHLFPPRYIHLIQELARQAAIAGACVIMTPEMNITVQSLMATGHNLVRTEHPESLEHRCQCRKRKHKLLRQVQRRNERHMSRYATNQLDPEYEPASVQTVN
jgi:hypothetical protein